MRQGQIRAPDVSRLETKPIHEPGPSLAASAGTGANASSPGPTIAKQNSCQWDVPREADARGRALAEGSAQCGFLWWLA